jgi:lactate dehydrogenase-like 2-hydroxyacid dehydrogenase
MKPVLLITIAVSAADRAQIAKRYEVLYAPEPAERDARIAERKADIRAILTNGTTGVSVAQMAELPKLELICALGVGYENIDVEAARARGVAVANGAGTNAACVADHAMALLLATVRTIPALDAFTRTGQWRESLSITPGFSGKKLGLLGLGLIAQQIARRGAGFDLAIGYHSRTRHDAFGFDYFESAVALAEWADFLVVATPGGAATHHMVNAAVLKALGPHGYLVNIARGTVVDTAALADALRRGALGGAGLDVYESEPEPPRELFEFPNVVLTPHVGGRSPDAIAATVERFLENAGNHFAGKPMVSPL